MLKLGDIAQDLAREEQEIKGQLHQIRELTPGEHDIVLLLTAIHKRQRDQIMLGMRT